MVLFHTDDAVLSGFRRLARSPALAAAEMPAKTRGSMISRPDIVVGSFPFGYEVLSCLNGMLDWGREDESG